MKYKIISTIVILGVLILVLFLKMSEITDNSNENNTGQTEEYQR